jgi:hypothetical protein
MAGSCSLQPFMHCTTLVKMGSERPDAYAALLNCLQNPKRPLLTVLGFNVGTELMYGFGGWLMPRVQLPAVTPKRKTWNKGRIIGQERPLLPKQVWAIRTRLEIAGSLRDLALLNAPIRAIGTGLRHCNWFRTKRIWYTFDAPHEGCGDLPQNGKSACRTIIAWSHQSRHLSALLGRRSSRCKENAVGA